MPSPQGCTCSHQFLAEVSIKVTQMPFSDPVQTITTIITGQANEYGYFQPPPGTEILLLVPRRVPGRYQRQLH